MNSKKRKTRVLLFTSRFPRWQGDSVCNFVYYLAKDLVKYYDVYVLAPHDSKARHKEIMANIRVRRFRYFFPWKFQKLSNEHGLMANIQSSWIGKLQVLPFMLVEFFALVSLVKKEAIDVVNSHWIVPQGLLASAVQKFISFHHFVTIHYCTGG
ncbi:MAG: glycosyltransferase family 4 protein [bacterium]